MARSVLKNDTYSYKKLSDRTAVAPRAGEFPDLIDNTRWIHRRAFWGDAVEAMRDRADHYRGDRLAGQDYAVYIATEKQGLLAQLDLLVPRALRHSGAAARRLGIGAVHQ